MKITKQKMMQTGGPFVVLMAFCLITCCSEQEGIAEKEDAAGMITYEESLEIFPNPDRGFYHSLAVHNNGPGLSIDALRRMRQKNTTLILRLYYLEDYKDQPIGEAVLSLIKNDMQTLRDAGLKCVLRFAYTDNINGTDAPLNIVKQHLDQLEPVFESSKDVIAVVQAGFIGAWGEWHSSSNGLATVENEREILFKLLDVLPDEIMVQVRTPRVKQLIFDTTQPIGPEVAYTDNRQARVGHHNDCFLTGGTDYGTYSDNKIQAEKNYISKEARYVFTGGETCPPTGDFPACSMAKAEMKLLKWTYLNLDYYGPVLNGWRKSGCFEEFQRKLGYRLALVHASLPEEAVEGEDYTLEIAITNKGYAPLYHFKTTTLVFKSLATGENYSVRLPVDVRDIKPDDLFTIKESLALTGIPSGEYALYLEIADGSESLKNSVAYKVRLANKDSWDPDSGMNSLKREVKITAK